MQNTRRQEVQRSWAQARVFNWFLDNYKCILYFFFCFFLMENQCTSIYKIHRDFILNSKLPDIRFNGCTNWFCRNERIFGKFLCSFPTVLLTMNIF